MKSAHLLSRVKLHAIKGENLNQPILVCGWIRSVRNQKSFTFIELNDGSTLSNLQVIVEETLPGYQDILPNLTTGASLRVEGTLVD